MRIFRVWNQIFEHVREKKNVRMNVDKIKTILKWKTSKSIKNVQSFFKFVNFYKRFIANFFKKIKCFIELTKNEQYVIFDEKKNKISKISMKFWMSINVRKIEKNVHKNVDIDSLRFFVENVNKNKFIKFRDNRNVISNVRRNFKINNIFFQKNEFDEMQLHNIW